MASEQYAKHKTLIKKILYGILLVWFFSIAWARPHQPMFTIVLDPGHGGFDPGTIGPKGSEEKKIALQMAKRLKIALEKDPRLSVLLTRTTDSYVKLQTRLNFIRSVKPILFISIHADAYKNTRARGASVFILSKRGSRSSVAKWLVHKEYQQERDQRIRPENAVLMDLSPTTASFHSYQLGNNLLKQLNHAGHLHTARVEQAGFMVLKSRETPSVLLELGFVSNPREERFLNTSWYQDKLAHAITLGVLEYLKSLPPLRLAQEKPAHYRVRARDTLYSIAKRHHLSVATLQKLNRLRHTAVYVGQLLKIQ